VHRHTREHLPLLLVVLSAVFFSACAEIRVSEVPLPASSPKLRVYVEPFTTFAEGKRGKSAWKSPHEEFVTSQVRLIERYLAQTGIYEIVSNADVHAAIGDQVLTRYQLERNDWATARKIGRALHADYVMIMERGSNSLANEIYFFNALINVETGRKFGVQYSFQKRGIRGEMKEIVRASYRDIFNAAKDDLLATAIRKGRRMHSPQVQQQAQEVTPPRPKEEHRPVNTVTAPLSPAPAPVPAEPRGKNVSVEKPLVSAPAAPEWVKQRAIEDVLMRHGPTVSGAKLVVYDFDSPEQYRPAALILSEALREELFKMRKFTLVNRENLDQVLKEMALQQTGLIDEKQAVKTGRGLAANQVVTGTMGLLGKTFVLQAKRIDVETFATLGLASTKFSAGHEDDAFDKMQEFATHLTGR
jgi:hypothetical protein